MGSDRGTELHYSSIRVRPTLAGWSVLTGVVLVAILSHQSRVSYGFILIIAGVAVVDFVMTKRAFAARDIGVSPLALTAESPQQLAVTLSAEEGIPMTITAFPFSEIDGVAPAHATTLGGGAVAEPVYFSDGALPLAKRHVRFARSASRLGLVHLHQTVAYVGTQFFHRIPKVLDLVDPVHGVSEDEVGRLRPYIPGDRRSRVSWIATARTGSLHVRDALVDEYDDVVVVAQIGQIEDLSEPERIMQNVTASTAAVSAVVADLLAQGIRVTLRTFEMSELGHDNLDAQIIHDPTASGLAIPDEFHSQVNLVERQVPDRTELIRRLAHAEIGLVPAPSGPYLEVSHTGVRSVS